MERRIGDIALSKDGRIGILTSSKKELVNYPGKDKAYIGIHAMNYMVNDVEIKIGDVWYSRNPIFLGNINDIISTMMANQDDATNTIEHNTPSLRSLDENTDTLGLSLNDLSKVISLWGKKQQFDIPTSLKTREDRMLMNEKLLLVVTEVAEVCEALRKLDFEEVEKELADIIIRTLNITGTLKIDIDKMVSEKMKINRGRPPKHGKDF